MNKEVRTLSPIVIEDLAAEGKAIFRYEGRVYFIQNVIPGDVVSVQLTKRKKKWGEALLLRIEKPSVERIEPFCQHFGICGGCRWQMLPYHLQMAYKKKEVIENIRRIGGVPVIADEVEEIPCEENKFYRNKLEFAFSNKTYLSKDLLADKQLSTFVPALGYHTNRIFDKVIPIEQCMLMDEVHNDIRNALFAFCVKKGFSFYDRRTHQGLMRNVVIRITTLGQILLNVIFGEINQDATSEVMDFLKHAFVSITSLYYTINLKHNDTIYDLKPVCYAGKPYIVEKLGCFEFELHPKSFFQTNTLQAEKLYQKVLDYAGLDGTQNVLDLYAGVGSIGIFLSQKARRVLGVEVVQEAVEDARRNKTRNQIPHIEFVCGDIDKLVQEHYFDSIGFRIDVLIIDPPRAGITTRLIELLKSLSVPKILYVSCNSASAARDLALMADTYQLKRLCVVDMFPHTHHIESVLELVLR